MIRSAGTAAAVEKGAIRSHYDLATPFYRLLWGPHIHHGLWPTATDVRDADTLSPRAAQEALTDTLVPAVRTSIVKRGLPGPLYGCFYCIVTCAALLTAILCWRPIDVVVWRWPVPLDTIVSWCFVGSWAALLYSLHLTGLGWQTGLTPWWHWVRGRPVPKRAFVERGAYRVLRHPVYLSFLGLVWFVPVVALDRGVLITIWSLYIFVGSVLKDGRLLHFLGAAYREYQSRVPGYPGMPFGPLARVD